VFLDYETTLPRWGESTYKEALVESVEGDLGDFVGVVGRLDSGGCGNVVRVGAEL
jgi:hypothetical protein